MIDLRSYYSLRRTQLLGTIPPTSTMAIKKGSNNNNTSSSKTQDVVIQNKNTDIVHVNDKNITVDGSVHENTLQRGTEIATLFHRKERKRTQSVRLETVSSLEPASSENGKWVVPCDLVGTEAKKMKNLKIRVHPSTLEQCSCSTDLVKTLEDTAHSLLSSILGDEWSLMPLKRPDVRLDTVRRLRKMLSVVEPVITYKIDCLEVRFPLVSLCKKDAKYIDEGRSVLGKGTALHVEVEKISGENGSREDALISLSFHSGDFQKTLWSLSATPFAYFKNCANIEITQHSFAFTVARSDCDAERCPPRVATLMEYCSFRDCGKEMEKKMFESRAESVSELRRRLDESLVVFNKKEGRGEPRCIGLINKNREQVIFHLGKDKASMMRPSTGCPLSPVSLSVDVSSSESVSNGIASSPAGSEDSGISGSPAGSPKNTSQSQASPFYMYSSDPSSRLSSMFRQRSKSESCPPSVKGILRWPQPRTTFARSISECHSDEKELTSSLARTPTFDADDDIEEGEECVSPMVSRKKRVSFSETVEQKVFKKGSTILHLGKKKERTVRMRTESIEETASETDPFDAEEAPSFEKLGLRTQDRQDSGFCEGDDEIDGEMKDGMGQKQMDPEESWMRMVRSQRKRWSSEGQA